MVLVPFAKIELLPESGSQGKINPTQIVLHTAVDGPGSTDLHNYFNSPGIGTESHFFIQNDGDIFQYMNTTTRADAQFDANVRAISIETEDDGSVTSWTVDQINSIKRLGNFLMGAHPGILRRVCPAQDLPGWGYHSLFPQWNKNNHSCPGGPRIHQFNTDITTWLRAPARVEEDDMPYTQEELKGLFRSVLNEGTGPGQSTWKGTSAATLDNIYKLGHKLDSVHASVRASAVDVEELATKIAEKLDPENVSVAAVEEALKNVLGSLDE